MHHHRSLLTEFNSCVSAGYSKQDAPTELKEFIHRFVERADADDPEAEKFFEAFFV